MVGKQKLSASQKIPGNIRKISTTVKLKQREKHKDKSKTETKTKR